MLWYGILVKALPILGSDPGVGAPAVASPSGGFAQLPTLRAPQEDNGYSQACTSQECAYARSQDMIEELQSANNECGQADCSVTLCDQDQPKDEEIVSAEVMQEYNEQDARYAPVSPPSVPMVLNKMKMPRPKAITIHDKITKTVISTKTSLIEKPPVTVTYTKMLAPVTTTLPPLVFRVPTTIVKMPRPETVTKIMPPKVIYPPPVITTVHHKVQSPPSTVVVSSVVPPIIRTVTMPAPPLTVVRVLTSTITTQATPPETQYHTSSPSPASGALDPDRINPFLGYAFRNRLMYGLRNDPLYRNRDRIGSYSEAFNPLIYPMVRSAGSYMYDDPEYDEFGIPAQDVYDLALLRPSGGRRCVRGSNDCYVSMMSSSLGLPLYEPDCSESDARRSAQKYPDVISLGEESIASTATSRSPKSVSASTEKESPKKPHSSSRTGTSKVVYMSELIDRDE